jgi:hypothetical protein
MVPMVPDGQVSLSVVGLSSQERSAARCPGAGPSVRRLEPGQRTVKDDLAPGYGRGRLSCRCGYGRPVTTLDDVATIALGLPGTTEGERHGTRTWAVRGAVFAWERPLSKADLRRFGAEAPPAGPILAVKVEDLGEKEALLAARPRALFTIPHFDGYAAVLVRLRSVSARALRETVLDGWLACAPAELARTYVRHG